MSVTIPFRKEFVPRYGEAETLSPLVRRVLAQNPGPFTFYGTGTFIVGHGEVAVIDPGPDLPRHVEALLAALVGERVSHIIVTHQHPDHNGAVEALRLKTGAPVYAFDTSVAAQSIALRDGDSLASDGWGLEAIHTPGHAATHLCLALAQEETVFTGDHVMGWSTSVIAPPDGDLDQYLDALEKLATRPEQLYRPTHGAEVTEGSRFARALHRHRLVRSGEILAAVRQGAQDMEALIPRIYPSLGPGLEWGAKASIAAHLHSLVRQGALAVEGETYRVA